MRRISLCFTLFVAVCSAFFLSGCSDNSAVAPSSASASAAPVPVAQAQEQAQEQAQGQAQGPTGEETYNRYCLSCHAIGVAGAPKVGKAEDWAPRIARGVDALLASSIEGVPPGMPARGLCSSCSDDELRDAISYMIEQ